MDNAFISALLHYCMIKCLTIIYLFGPLLGGWGFWRGTPREEVCSYLLGTSVSMDEIVCTNAIEKQINFLTIPVYTVMGIMYLRYQH